MKLITVVFHDDPQSPTPGLRDSVKSIASSAGAQVRELGTNRLDISCTGMSMVQSVWVGLQDVEGVEISSNCTAAENTVLTQAVQEAAKAKESKPARRSRSSGSGE